MDIGNDRAMRLGTKTEQLYKWYDENAPKFKDAVTVEQPFIKLTPEEQYRLNRFKLWFLEDGNAVFLQGKRILEFGCGHGRLAIEVRGYESYLGVDVCAELVRIGEERLKRAGLVDRAHLVTSDCLAFEGPEEYFDVVCSLGMFAFVEDVEASLRKMCAHLKPGGILFANFYHASPLYDVIRRLRWRLAERRGGIPKQLFGEAEIRSFFAAVGLADMPILMIEYPPLDTLYAHRGWPWVLKLRNQMARRPWLNIFATDFVAIANKPR